MIALKKNTFLGIIDQFENKPFTMTEAWIDYYQSKGRELIYLCDSEFQPQIIAWGTVKKFKLIGAFLSLEGFMYRANTSVKKIQQFMIELTELEFAAIYMNPNIPYDPKFEVASRIASFRKPMAQSSISLTMVVELDSHKIDRNWKRNLKKANKENYKILFKKEISNEESQQISDLHRENAELKNLNEYLSPAQVAKMIQKDNQIFACLLFKGNKIVGARIISVEKEISFDMFACNSESSRNNGANHFLMKEIFEFLRKKGVSYFDFSRIPIGKESTNGIYLFKNGAGGKLVQYVGEWWWSKKKYLAHLQYARKRFILKQEFY